MSNKSDTRSLGTTSGSIKERLSSDKDGGFIRAYLKKGFLTAAMDALFHARRKAGNVPVTYPPGMVFNMGTWLTPEEQLIPIRLLHFEQRRVVIDVAGPSSAITAIFERLQQFLSELQAADGSPVIGKPERILDYSEIVARFPFSLESFFVPSLGNLFARIAHKDAKNIKLSIAPMFVIQTFPENEEVAALGVPSDPYAFTFALRTGTRPEEHIYASNAPLDSEAHLAYLNELESSLGQAS